MLTARFDDLRPGRKRSFGFATPTDTLLATTLDDVVATLGAAQSLANSGKWLAGFVSYEAAPALDPTLATLSPSGFPLVGFNVYDEMVSSPTHPPGAAAQVAWSPNVDEHTYNAHINHIHELIRAGETYQVNYTLRMQGAFDEDARPLYRDLVRAQAGGYGAFLEIGPWQIASASPELFFRWDRDGRLVTRPMKGTTRRGRFTAEDEALVDALVASEKERAENVMIVDLIRNDLGRVAEFGSVSVTDLFAVEQYETVWQMTSTIEAQTRDGVDLVDVFRALFPSGSVTGAPKTATMKIISDLETSPRNVYCGAIGVLAPPSASEPLAQFNVPIRTVLHNTATNDAEYGVGGGITYDSTSGGEYAEMQLKTEVLGRSPEQFTLLETMRADPDSGIWLLDQHLARLADSGQYLGFRLDISAIRSALDAIAVTGPTRIRLLANDDDFSIETSPLVVSPKPRTLAIDTVAIDRRDFRLFHKTTSRRTYEAAAARHPTADDVVLINADGNVTETTIGNIVARIDGTWLTPPMVDGCLPGTYRAELISDGSIVEASISIEEFTDAAEVAVVNSVRGWLPAKILTT